MAEVLVVDRTALFGGDWPQGFVAVAPAEAERFLAEARRGCRYVARDEAEQAPAWKQWIPYCVIRCMGPESPTVTGPEGIFRVRRSSGQTESRLHGLWSIGLGGHIEPVDGDPNSPGLVDRESFFANALRRELDEELELPRAAAELSPQFLGLLNDDSTAVGSVHAGLVFTLDLALPLAEAKKVLSVREISKMSGGFGSLVELANLWQDPMQFESWSQILIHAGVAGHMGASTDVSDQESTPNAN